MRRSYTAEFTTPSRRWSLGRATLKAASIGTTLVLVRLGLTVFGLRRVREHLLPSVAPGAVDRWAARWLCRRVFAAARFVPYASCLTRAQACQVLLARRGLASTLYLGVRRTRTGALIAHAWLVSGTEVVTGGEGGDVELFTPLLGLGPAKK